MHNDNFSETNNRTRRKSLNGMLTTTPPTEKEYELDLSNYTSFPRKNSLAFENVFMIETDLGRKLSLKESMIPISNGNFIDLPRYDEEQLTFWHRLLNNIKKFCKPCLRNSHTLPENPTKLDKFKYNLLLPPIGFSAKLIAFLVTILLLYGILWAILKADALPGGNIFSLFFLILTGYVAGKLVRLIKMPALFGMLMAGMALRNIPVVNEALQPNNDWSSTLRNVALCVILIRAGLGLDSKALKRLKLTLFLLAVLPCLTEAAFAAVLSHYLINLPWLWAFILGFVYSAASPSIIVSCMLRVMKAGYGLDKGIPTLLIAATTIDDVIAISCFSILLGVIFSEGTLLSNIARGPLEVIIGLSFGIVMGIFGWFFPSESDKHMIHFRFLILLFGGLFALFVSRAIDYSGAGALGILSFSFIASRGWRRQGWKKANPVGDHLKVVWTVLEPTLFTLVGNQIDFSMLNSMTTAYGVAMIVILIVIRMAATVIALTNSGFSWKEKLYSGISRCAKATVQAAIGSIALDTARAKDANSTTIELAKQILLLSVLVIVITAPSGSILITVTASKLLNHTPDPNDGNKTESTILADVTKENLEEGLEIVAKQGYENEGFTYSDVPLSSI